jgi:hypothetical protein
MYFSIVQKDLRKKLILDTIEYILFGYNLKKQAYRYLLKLLNNLPLLSLEMWSLKK